MKKKNYRLNTVVEVRRKGKEAASRNVFLCRDAVEKATSELERRKDVLSKHRFQIAAAERSLDEEMEKGVAASSILSHKSYIEGLRDAEAGLIQEVNDQTQLVTEAESALETAILILAEASRELSVIEKHKKKWQTSEQKRVTKQEQKLLDEISSILHERSKKL